MLHKKALFIALFPLLLPIHLLAWGHKGHQIVAELAMHQISDVARQKVLQVLGTMIPEQAGTWMDDMRNDPAYKYTAPWHYTNIEVGKQYQPEANGDIITALNAAYNELQHMDTLRPDRLRFDMLVLFHLCGDLMQPLHVGYGSDKGGNTYQVQFNGKGTNLHHIWDTDIIETNGISTASLISKTTPQKIPIETRLKSYQVNFEDVMGMSRRLLPTVYAVKGHKIDSTDIQNYRNDVEMALRQGGFLLAACLEQLFNNTKNTPEVIAPFDNSKRIRGDTVYEQVLIPKVREEDIPQMIGQTVSVCSRVYNQKFLGGDSPTFLNMGAQYPNQIFTVVIMAKDRKNFTYKPEEQLNGEVICIIGKVIEHKGKPEIIVEREEQIKLQ